MSKIAEVANLASVKRRHIRFYTKKLGMSKVIVSRVPKQLTEDQKVSRVTIAKEHLGVLPMMKMFFELY